MFRPVQRMHILAYGTCFFFPMRSVDEVEEEQEALFEPVDLETDSCQGSHTYPLFVVPATAEVIVEQQSRVLHHSFHNC